VKVGRGECVGVREGRDVGIVLVGDPGTSVESCASSVVALSGAQETRSITSRKREMELIDFIFFSDLLIDVMIQRMKGLLQREAAGRFSSWARPGMDERIRPSRTAALSRSGSLQLENDEVIIDLVGIMQQGMISLHAGRDCHPSVLLGTGVAFRAPRDDIGFVHVIPSAVEGTRLSRTRTILVGKRDSSSFYSSE
jgi:hypothetical protein